MAIEDLRAQLAAKKAAIRPLTPEELEEEGLYADIAKFAASGAEADRRRRALELDRAIDAAKATNPHAIFRTCDLEDDAPGAGHYVLRSPGKVQWDTFQRELEAAGAAQRLDPAARATLIMSCIVFPSPDTDGPEIRARWDKRPAALLTLFNVVTSLAGLKTAEDAKRAR